MLAMRHKVFRFGLERFGWNWRFGFQRSPKALIDLRRQVEAFADEVGPENVVSIAELGQPFSTMTVWYRAEAKAPAKPARVAVGDEYFAASGAL